MSRLVMVSNRVSLPSDRSSPGGLAVAIRDILRDRGGLWFGWSGKIARESSATPQVVAARGVTYATVTLSQVDHHAYYTSFSNSTLWPLLHYRLGLIEYKRHAFEGYLKVNRYLARLLAPFLKPQDLIWVHDYHLIPIGAELRALGVKNRIGFFLHTPFPAAEVLASLPNHERLVAALAEYDLIGLQTAGDVQAFASYIERIAHGRYYPSGLFTAYDRTSRVAAFPIGIDAAPFAEFARTKASAPEAARLKASLAGRDLIIGVDRLDYSKALPNRFAAIEVLLSEWPANRGKFTYLQIAPISRSEVRQYQNLRRELEAAAGRVNGKFAECDWTPIRYVNKNVPRPILAAYYRLARVGLVTPFRDGMNLVAKEFVAAQDPENPGVLILSRFAGAASELSSALIINPFDIDELASALNQGLAMALGERRQRWEAMMQAVSRNTVETWRDSFVRSLAGDRPVAAFAASRAAAG